MRSLILFDIDGTLLTTDGAAKRAFRRALLDVYGTAGPIESHDFAGKTDPQIARELLREAGRTDEAIDDGLDELWNLYLRGLAEELERSDPETMLMTGAAELVDVLEARDDVAVRGLLTGNIERGAAIKLGAVGLAGRFRPGAYGSDSEHRHELPALAAERARSLTGQGFDGSDIVILGDTPHDVTCGEALGVRAVAVATGRHDAAALAAAGAETVLPDLADTDRVLDVLLSASSTAAKP